jgi:hypothetical protein
LPDINGQLAKRDYDYWHVVPPPPPGPPEPVIRQERAVDVSKGSHLIGKRPTEWKVELTTFGMPGDDQFRVVIRPNMMYIKKSQFPKGEGTTLFDGPIDSNEANEIFNACLRTLERFRFQDESSGLSDGSGLSISITANSQILSAAYYNMQFVEEAGTEVKNIMQRINSHLTKEKVF